MARAINAASGNRPLVVLANLSGFDGSPESMRALQLEYGAEIGRAIVNFDGPIVFTVVSRYHGGAFVVFSKTLNPRMTVLAVEGSFASVLGGAPAAAVVFSRDVDARTTSDPRVAELESQLASASGVERARLATELAEVRSAVRSEKLGQVAAGVRRRAQHPARRDGRLGRRRHRAARDPAADHRRRRGRPAGLTDDTAPVCRPSGVGGIRGLSTTRGRMPRGGESGIRPRGGAALWRDEDGVEGAPSVRDGRWGASWGA